MNDSELRPQLIVVGGPNGAGKTTYAKRFVAEFAFPYLGADEVAFELSPDDPYAVRMEAGRLFLERYYERVDRRESFIVESTLSGRTFRKEIQAARDAGYEVEMVFCFLGSKEQAVARVAKRMEKGGHYVPPEDIRRRYVRCLRNFWTLYRPLADRWTLAYNGDATYGEVVVQIGGDMTVFNQRLFDKFRAGIAENE